MVKSTRHYEYFGCWVSKDTHPILREMFCIQHGGRWKGWHGKKCGNGLFYHYKEIVKIIWPEVAQHRWFDLYLENWLAHKFIGVIGGKNTGKSLNATVCHLVDYYCFPECTTIMICSTTRDRLEDRIWGEIKKYHRLALSRFPFLPGNLIESKQRIVTDSRDEAAEGRDFRNGIVGVPCKKGDKYVGISDFQGIKNKRIRLCGDELAALPKSFIDAIATLDMQADLKVTGMGNPAQITDALGLLCEPDVTLGGWESGIDQTPKTKTWKTRWPDGICIQFAGSDSPNMDVPKGQPAPYPFLMTREVMEQDMRTWGSDDWHYTMFNEGRMPHGQGSRRVITRQICLKHLAMEPPIWLNSNLTYITSLDAAYRGVGGDRCVLMRLAFGPESYAPDAARLVEALVNQGKDEPQHRIILALLDTLIVPIKASDFESPEDQIVMYVKKHHEDWHIPPENFFYDSGMRTSLVTAFARLWSPKVNSIDCGGKPYDRQVSGDIDINCQDYYDRLISQFWWTSRLVIESTQLRGLSEEVVNEGSIREWKMVGANKISIETKDEMKVKSGRSPDLYDCLVIGIEGAQQRGFVVRKLAEEKPPGQMNQWKRDLLRKAAEFRRSHQLVETA